MPIWVNKETGVEWNCPGIPLGEPREEVSGLTLVQTRNPKRVAIPLEAPKNHYGDRHTDLPCSVCEWNREHEAELELWRARELLAKHGYFIR